MDGGDEPLFIGISVLHFSIGNQDFFLRKQDGVIAFKITCLSTLSTLYIL